MRPRATHNGLLLRGSRTRVGHSRAPHKVDLRTSRTGSASSSRSSGTRRAALISWDGGAGLRHGGPWALEPDLFAASASAVDGSMRHSGAAARAVGLGVNRVKE